MDLREKLMQVEKRMGEIKTEISGDGITSEILTQRKEEIETLKESRADLRNQIDILDSTDFKPYENKGNRNKIADPEQETRTNEVCADLKSAFDKAKSEKREQVITLTQADIAGIKQRDATGIDTENILLTPLYNTSIAPSMPQYSNAGDMVQVVDAIGNQKYIHSFEIDIDEADYVDDGQTYKEGATNFGNVVIEAGKITTTATVTEGLMKLTSIPFAQRTLNNVYKSLKKKVAKALVLGDGSSIDGDDGILKKFVGIYNATGKVAPVEIESSGLTVDTLADFMLEYGNDEVTGGFGQVLMLNKKDLKTLVKLKDTSTRYFYKWEPNPALNGNGGRLTVGEIGKSKASEMTVDYIINSACNAMADADADSYTMIYGNLYDYVMAMFGDLELRTKREDNGNYSVFASMYAGGNIGGYKKFVVMKKVASE